MAVKCTSVLIFVLCLLVVIYIVPTSTKNVPHSDRCTGDEHCKQGEYCTVKRHLCRPCTNCTKYNRHPGKIECIKEVKHCGSCLPGHTDRMNFFDDPGVHCFLLAARSRYSTALAHHQTESASREFNPSLLVACVLCAVALGAVGVFKCRKPAQIDTLPSNCAGTPPPPYNDQQNAIDSNSWSTGSVATLHLQIDEQGDNDKQRAVPFRPNYQEIQNCNGHTETNSSSEHSQDGGNASPSNNNNDEMETETDQADSANFLESSSSELSSSSSDEFENNAECSPPRKRRKEDGDSESSDGGNSVNFNISIFFPPKE